MVHFFTEKRRVVYRCLILLFAINLSTGYAFSQKTNQDIILSSQRNYPEDENCMAFLASQNCSNSEGKVNEFIKLRNKYIQKQDYKSALFLANEFTQKLNEYENGKAGAQYLQETLILVPTSCENSNIEWFVSMYLMARYGDSDTRLQYFESLLNSDYKLVSLDLYFLSNLYYGVELINQNKPFEGAAAWEYCLENIEKSPYKSEAYYAMGKVIGEKDAEASLMLLKRALQLSKDELHRDAQFQYDCLKEIVQIYVSIASDENEEQSTDLAAELYSKKAHRLLKDSSLHIYENEASTSVYRIASESLLWLGKDTLVAEYMQCFEQNNQCYNDKELTDGFVNIVHGVAAYIRGEYTLSNQFFKSSIEIIGSETDYLNRHLELPYAYIGSNYHMLENFPLAIEFMENSIKTLLSDYYAGVDEGFKFLPVEQITNSPNCYNVIMCLLRIQYFYQLALSNEVSPDSLNRAQDLTQYIGDLINAWFLSAASEETLTLATELIKRNNAFAIELVYKYGAISEMDKTDEIFLLATEASSFYLNYLKKLKVSSDNNDIESALVKKISDLTKELNQYDKQNLNDELILKNLALLKAKMELSKKKEVDMQPYISNQELPSAAFALNEKTAVIKYFAHYHNIYIAYYTPNGKGVEHVVFRDYEQKIRSFKRSVKSGSQKTNIQHLFYREFIHPIAEKLTGIETLYILNDEAFGELPFELLLNEGNEPLVKQFNIKYFYSTRNINRKEQFDIESETFVGIAPGFTNQEENYSPWRNGLSPLYHSLSEVKQLDSLCRDKHISSRIYLEEDATLSAFYESLEKADVLHLSTHGTSVKNSEKGLFFTEKAGDSGFLSLTDLYGVDIHADLVVLAACKAAIGDVATGEGIMALPRGFMYAGVPNVIATLWNVDDEKATELMLSFYQHLWDEPNNYEKALRLAKLDCIAKGYIPLDWAGFILIGN